MAPRFFLHGLPETLPPRALTNEERVRLERAARWREVVHVLAVSVLVSFLFAWAMALVYDLTKVRGPGQFALTCFFSVLATPLIPAAVAVALAMRRTATRLRRGVAHGLVHRFTVDVAEMRKTVGLAIPLIVEHSVDPVLARALGGKGGRGGKGVVALEVLGEANELLTLDGEPRRRIGDVKVVEIAAPTKSPSRFVAPGGDVRDRVRWLEGEEREELERIVGAMQRPRFVELFALFIGACAFLGTVRDFRELGGFELVHRLEILLELSLGVVISVRWARRARRLAQDRREPRVVTSSDARGRVIERLVVSGTTWTVDGRPGDERLALLQRLAVRR